MFDKHNRSSEKIQVSPLTLQFAFVSVLKTSSIVSKVEETVTTLSNVGINKTTDGWMGTPNMPSRMPKECSSKFPEISRNFLKYHMTMRTIHISHILFFPHRFHYNFFTLLFRLGADRDMWELVAIQWNSMSVVGNIEDTISLDVWVWVLQAYRV